MKKPVRLSPSLDIVQRLDKVERGYPLRRGIVAPCIKCGEPALWWRELRTRDYRIACMGCLCVRG